MNQVRTIVFPVGGLGTRFLPATKAIPKEMLPVAEKPLIQYAFEEALEAGIERFIFVTSRNKNAIEDHFDNAFELQNNLQCKKRDDLIEKVVGWLPKAGRIIFLRQQNPYGLGHAILCARYFVGNEPFIVSLADDMVYEEGNYIKRMLDVFYQNGGKANIIGVNEIIHKEDTKKYGIIGVSKDFGSYVKIDNMVEKPSPEDAPSDLSIVGRYILQPDIFSVLEKTDPGLNQEVQLTDAMRVLLKNQDFYGLKFHGKRFDCGSVVGCLEANINYALRNDNISAEVKKIIKSISKELE